MCELARGRPSRAGPPPLPLSRSSFRPAPEIGTQDSGWPIGRTGPVLRHLTGARLAGPPECLHCCAEPALSISTSSEGTCSRQARSKSRGRRSVGLWWCPATVANRRARWRKRAESSRRRDWRVRIVITFRGKKGEQIKSGRRVVE